MDNKNGFIKRLIYLPTDDCGQPWIVPIYSKASYIDKLAAKQDLLPKVAEFIASIKPDPEHRHVLINALGAGEWWGCFPPGEQVLLESGVQKNIETVCVGDRVKTHACQFKDVEKLWKRDYSGEVLSIKLTGSLTSARMTPNHPVFIIPRDDLLRLRRKYVYFRDQEISFSTAMSSLIKELPTALLKVRMDEIQTGDVVIRPFETRIETTKEISDLSIARLLGYYLAEGCLVFRPSRNKEEKKKQYADRKKIAKGIVYVFGTHEPEVHEEVLCHIQSLGHTTKVKKIPNAKAVRIEFNSIQFHSLCKKYVGHGSKTKYLSAEIKKMPLDWQLAFIGAYFSGDGNQPKAGKSYGYLRASTASRQLALDLQEVLFRLGIPASLNSRFQTTTPAKTRTIHEIQVTRHAGADKLRPFTKFPTIEESCVDNAPSSIFLDQQQGVAYLSVSKINYSSYEGPVYNLQVADDHSYIVSNLAVGNSNKNGDVFYEDSLAPTGEKFGHKTFLKAGFYKHHINKCKTKSSGEVLLSEYNPKMHRVELVVKFAVDKDPSLAALVDEGQLFACSMGTKVPSDFCSICNHESKTVSDYCECLTDSPGMNRIVEDGPNKGKIACAINKYPNFFDISRVLIGADKTARSYGKIASAEQYPSWFFMPSGLIAIKLGDVKDASINKEVTVNAEPVAEEQAALNFLASRSILDASDQKNKIEKADLKKAAAFDVDTALSSFASLGIKLTPAEFQYMLLTKTGNVQLADNLDKLGYAFAIDTASREKVASCSKFIEISLNKIEPFLIKTAEKYLYARSVRFPFILERAIVLDKTKFAGYIKSNISNVDIKELDTISGLYTVYLNKLAEFGPDGLRRAEKFIPEVINALTMEQTDPFVLNRSVTELEKVAAEESSGSIKDFVIGSLLSPKYKSSLDVVKSTDPSHWKLASTLQELTPTRIRRLHPDTSAWATILTVNLVNRRK